VTADDVTRGMCADPGGQRQRHEGEARRERPQAEDVLQVERAEQEEAEDRPGRREHEEDAAGDRAIRESLDAQERRRGAALEDGERAEADEATETAEQRLERGPAGALALADREHDGAEARGRERGSPEVEPAPAWRLRVGRHDPHHGDGERRCDRQVDVEDHAPVAELGEQAADEHADRGAGTSDRSPGGERLRAPGALEGRHDDRERGRREERRTEALSCAGREQGGRGSRRRRCERRRAEDPEARQEHPPAAEQVGRAAAEEQQASEDQRVARDRPADVGAADPKISREARQRDVHRRDVEDHHQLGDQQDEQQDPAPLAGGRRRARSVMPGRQSLAEGRPGVARCVHVRLPRGLW
jgi:hypothetical protein